MRSLLVLVCCFLLLLPSSAWAFSGSYNGKVGNLLSSVVSAKVSSSGGSAAVATSTVRGVAGVLSGVAAAGVVGLAVGTPVGWLGAIGALALEAGVSGAVSIAAGGLYDWAFGNGKVTPPDSIPTNSKYTDGTNHCASAAACVAPGLKIPSNLTFRGIECSPNGPNFTLCNVMVSTSEQQTPGCKNSYPTCDQPYPYTNYGVYPDSSPVPLNGNYSVNPKTGTSMNSGNLPDYLASSTDDLDGVRSAPSSPFAASNDVPDSVASASLDPSVVAQAANEAWKDAAARPGYVGLPYDPSNAITGDDVSAAAAASGGMPTVGDAVTPISNPGTVGTAADGSPAVQGDVSLGGISSTGADMSTGTGT
ncbi:hypothetical protein, partial [Asaia siamensis]